MGGTGNGCRPHRRILVVLPGWVGDLVLATPALRAMKARFPEARFTGLLKGPYRPILEGGDWFDELLAWPGGGKRGDRHRAFLRLARELRARRFDWAVLMANSFRSALLARLAGIRRRIGYDRDGRGMLLTDRLLARRDDGRFVPVPMIRYYNAIARYLGCDRCPTQPELFTTDEQEREVTELLAARGVRAGQPIVVINPAAAFGPAKCWLPDRFAQVADQLIEGQGAAVFIVGGPNEVGVVRAVGRSMQRAGHVMADPVLKLGPLKALIRRASLLVTNDTGPRHFANAFGTPVVTVFGPTDQRWTLTDAPHEVSLQVPVDCGPCMKRECPLDHRCMKGIEVAEVLESGRSLLAEASCPAGRV